MKFQVPHSPRGLLGSGAGNWQAKLAKKRKKRDKSANLQHLSSLRRKRRRRRLSTMTTDTQSSNKIQLLWSFKIILLSSLLLIAILLLPTTVLPVRAQANASHPKRFRGLIRDSAESYANSSSLSWTKDKHNEVLKRLSLNGPSLLEALIKHPIQSNLPFPMLPTVTRRMPPPYSLNIPQTTASRERNLNQQKQTNKSTSMSQLNNKSSRPLLKVGGGLINVEHLVERLEENKKRLASVSKLEPTSGSNGKRKPQEHIHEPILPSDLESVKHQGLTLNMLIREEYDLRVKPMLKSLLDQQRVASASSVQSSTSTTTGDNATINNHRHEVSSSSNLFSTTLSPLEEQLGDHATRILFADKSDAVPTTPLPTSQPMTPSMSDVRNLVVTYENMEDRSDKIPDVEFDDKRFEEKASSRNRKRVKVNGASKNVKIIPPYQFGAGQFERPRAYVATGSQAAASSSSPKSVNGYIDQQFRYPTTRSSAASEVSDADATTRFGSLVFSDGAHEAERVKNLRQRNHLLGLSRPFQRKKIASTSSSLDVDVDEENDEDDDDDDPNEADNNKKERNRHNMTPNHLISSTMSPLEKLESRLKQNSSTSDAVFRIRDRKFAADQFTVALGPDWSRPMGTGRFSMENYGTTIANLPTTATTTSTTTTPSPHTEPSAMHPGNYIVNQQAIGNSQQPGTLTLPLDNSVLVPVSTPRYSFQLHEKPKKNATLYSIPNLSISEVINLRPRVRDVEPARKAQVSQDNLIGPLWSPSKIGHPPMVDTSGETQQVYRKKHTQPASSLQPIRTANLSSSYPMLVSVVGTKGMVVSGGNHSRPLPYSTPDYGQVTGDTETEPMLRTTTTIKPGRILGGSFFGDQHMESGHDLALRNDSGTIYTRFQQVDLGKLSTSGGLPRDLTNLTDKHDTPSRYWPASLDLGDVSRRRPSNSTHKTPPEDADLSEYARADEDEADDASEDQSLESPPIAEPRPTTNVSSSQQGSATGPRRRIIKDRVSGSAGAQQVVPAIEFVRKFKPYTQSKGFNPDSHEQAGSEIQMTEMDKAIQQADKKSSVPPLFKLGPRESSSEVVKGGTLSSSSPNGASEVPAGETGVSGEKVNEQTGKGSESRNELSTSATASAPVTKQQSNGSSTKQAGGDTRVSSSATKQSNDRLAFILIGGSCALSVVCLVLAAMSMRCQDMCDDYRSLRNAERAAMKLQKHRLKYTKSHQINRLSGGGHERGSASIDDLPDNLSLNHGALEAADISARKATSNKCLATNLGSNQHLSGQFGKSTAMNMNIWAASEPTSGAGNKESQCRCANCSRWLCLESAGHAHEKPQMAPWQSDPPSAHYCLHQAQAHPSRIRPLFGAGSSVGTFYGRRPDEHSAVSGGGFTNAQMLIDSQPAHTCSLLDGLRAPTNKQNNNNAQKAYQKQHLCSELAANFITSTAACNNPDHGHTHLCHNNHANRYNMETSTSDGGKLTLDESIHHCDGLAKCQHGASLSERIKLMQLRSNLHNSHTSTGWKHSDAVKATSKYHHQHHHHQHHQHLSQRHSKQHVHQSSSDSSSVDQCTCLHDNQPLLSKSHGRQVDRAAHKHLHHQHANKQEARYASHKTKRDKAMLVWSTNRDRLI